MNPVRKILNPREVEEVRHRVSLRHGTGASPQSSNGVKTAFITIFQGIEAKNLLRTSVLPELLKADDIRFVFFVRTAARAEFYRREFRDPQIIYEVADIAPHYWLDRILSFLKFHLIRTTTTDLRRRMEYDRTGNWFPYVLGRALNTLIARPGVRRIARWIDFCCVREPRLASFFDTYRPDVVFLAHLFDDAEVALLREARRRRIRTIGFVNSWDKLTARCAMRLLPDELLVYNEIVRREALQHADVPPERITVVGIPQYDRYRSYAPAPREAFLRRIGIDPGKRFILYAPMGEAFSTSDWDIIELLNRWVRDGLLGVGIELLVRFQPNDAINEGELAKRPWLHYDRPGTRFSRERGVDWDMREDEIRHLADTLAHASLLVCYASSLAVDAAIFDKPVININFEVRPTERLIKSPTQFYAMNHYQNALRTGGIRLVGSKDEFLDWLRRYLVEPALDGEGRARLVREQCGPLDGKAGERIADAVLAACGHSANLRIDANASNADRFIVSSARIPRRLRRG